MLPGSSRVRAVTFDADQTLWDFHAVMAEALESTAAFLADHGVVDVSTDHLQRVRDEVRAEASGSLHDLEAVRRESFRRVASSAGAADARALADAATAHYMAIRFGAIRLYDDVAATLGALNGHMPIGLLTNGNTDPERCGLPGRFDAVVMGPDHGVAKPDAAAFELIAAMLDVDPHALAHVGDAASDVDGANGVGAVSVLLDRDGTRGDLAPRATHRIATLHELPPLLGLT